MTKFEHILLLIKKYPHEPEKAAQEIELFTKRHWYPEEINLVDCPKYDKIINIQEPEPGMRCHHEVAYDSQSGHIYCGQPAYKIGESKKKPGLFYILCEEHFKGN